ncbi:hypothetical protein JY651_20745 [Pyxidicoccus parkwayensis]|uniref:Uncharacterized protein n=1 Tax=Pyxidicoccus parkwayensis TaxID=2813578 RepID=A0ABX7P9M3_9BACT|nr:hypothetical protein [Pyxidicoccus parkwaysis]QSQ27190.1 hypothetical protein JY651_20745 [Pyxidicoccus parkwaysis]
MTNSEPLPKIVPNPPPNPTTLRPDAIVPNPGSHPHPGTERKAPTAPPTTPPLKK